MRGDDRAARDILRARQGEGARYDAENAPHDDLLLARRGTAYFARKLNELTDDALGDAALRDGWSRRHLVAHVSLQARELAIALKALREPLIAEELEWCPDLALAATLPAHALRHLFEHSAKHLDVEWRDLPAERWDTVLTHVQDSTVCARATPILRAREIWRAAIELGNGGRWSDVPAPLRPAQSTG